MNIFRKIRDSYRRVRTWWRGRKFRRARRAAGAVADTAAAGTGLVLRMGVKVAVTGLLVFLTTGMILACIFAVYVKTCMNEELDLTPEELSSSLSSHIWVESSPGSNDWRELEILYATENRLWVKYEQIPIELEHAAVAIEDQRFYTHKGVDWWRTIGAFGNMFLSMSDTFGGSTLTQQLIKNLTGKDEVTVQRKLLEMFRALEFEKKYTKEEIVTWYLNEIYLGEGCYGVGAAAREYFGKEVWNLDLAECAALIGITNNPSLYDPYIGPESKARNKTRQELILHEMYDQGYITYEEYLSAKTETLQFKRAEGENRKIPIHSYYVDSLIWELEEDLAEARGITQRQAEMLIYNGGYNIYCCMNPRIQGIIDDIYQNTGNLPGSYYNPTGQKLSSAIVVIDPSDGAIMGLAGDTGEKTGSFTDNYATQLPRRPGSSFKPVAVYAPALDLGLITQNTAVNDSPSVRLRGSNWYPKNDGGGYSGVTSIRNGLIYSRNTVAAQVLDRIGLDASWNYLTQRFGFTSLVRDHLDETTGDTVSDYGYAALALGQLNYGITPKEMAQAYTAFANDGIMSRGRTYSLVTDSDGKVVLDNPADQRVAVKPNTAWNIDDMLSAAVKYGTGTMAYFGSTAIAGKTGTTSNNQDRYFTGFSRYYVAAVWTGYKYPAQMYFSSNPAAQIWRSVMSRIHEGLEWWSFNTPTVGGGGTLWGDALPTSTPEATATPEPSPEPTPENTEEPPPPEETAPPETEAPTDVPTDTPTDAPTDAPSDVPTDTPTDVPTDAPTDEPTPVPTDEPTPVPTDEPTPVPTDVPTAEPTAEPVVQVPTDVPAQDAPPAEVPDTPPEIPDLPPVEPGPVEPWPPAGEGCECGEDCTCDDDCQCDSENCTCKDGEDCRP